MIVVGTKNGLPAASDIENDSGVLGTYISDALDNLNSAIGAIVVPVNASDLTNDSTVVGITVADALNTLAGGGGGGLTPSEVIEPAPTGGQVITVTHPSVPLTGAGSGEIMFSCSATYAGPSHDSSPTAWEYEDINVNGASWVEDLGTVRILKATTSGTFNDYNYMFVGVDWATATKKALVRTGFYYTGTNIVYELLGTPDFIIGDAIKEWTGTIIGEATGTVTGDPSNSTGYGHFDVNPGPKLRINNRIEFVGGSFDSIKEIYGGDPTVPNSVVLSGTRPSAISSIHAMIGSGNSMTGGGDLSHLDIYYGISDVLIDSTDMPAMGGVTLSTFGYNGSLDPADDTYRAAVSLDNGVTWLVFDGASWVPILLDSSSLFTNGMRITYMGGGTLQSYPWLDTSGAALSAADWNELYLLMVAAGAGLQLRVVIGFDPSIPTAYTQATYIKVVWNEADSIRPILGYANYSSFGISTIERKTDTTTNFTVNGGMGIPLPTNLRCQVWTP